MNPWEALGIGQDVAVADLRRRYAALIKQFRPETHPQDFARIRAAYEVVLPIARRREFEAAGPAEPVVAPQSDAAVEETPHAPAADLSPNTEDEIAIDNDAITAVPVADEALAQAEEPRLAAHFRRFHALAESAAGTGDEALLPELRALLQARAQATLDDSQALEFALTRWFVEAGMPPLTLLFEAGRAFDWHHHAARLSTWLSPWALRQMEARLSMSRDLVHARHFSGNAWLRRLHSPRTEMSVVASGPATLEALRWAERWAHASDDAGAPALAACLNPLTLRRLRGRVLLTTDLIAGALVASAAPDLAGAAIYAVIGTAITFALRQALLWARSAPGRYRGPPAIARFLSQHRAITILAVGVSAASGIAFFLPADAGPASMVAGTLLLAPVSLLVMAQVWNVISFLERCAAELFAWRDAVDRLEFDRFLRGRVTAQAGAPFGSRLGRMVRWKAIPAALRFEAVEIALRARPARPPLFARLAALRRRPSLPRVLWFGAWIVFAILRVAHVIGANH
jgi:hypothetical protein